MEKTCTECFRGSIKPKFSREKFMYRFGFYIKLPMHILLPTCTNCNEVFLTEEEHARIKKESKHVHDIDQAEFFKKNLQKIEGNLGLSIREIEKVCGVRVTGFNPYLNGTEEADLTLMKFIKMLSMLEKDSLKEELEELKKFQCGMV